MLFQPYARQRVCRERERERDVKGEKGKPEMTTVINP